MYCVVQCSGNLASSLLLTFPVSFSYVWHCSCVSQKVLVKEVKTLRSQVDTMTTERSLHANQFRLLREALSLGGGGTAGTGLGSPNGGR